MYGEPNRARRRSTWNLIKHLARDNNLPWCLIGDMNNVLSQADKRGGRRYPGWLIQGFQEVLDECELFDMDMQGHPFTWERGRGTVNWVEIRLDRALVNRAWLDKFHQAKLINLEVTTSDHCPLLLKPKEEINIVRTKRFRFENAWLREPMCKKIVEEEWERAQPTSSLYDKISSCSTVLSSWGKDITGDFQKRINHSKNVLRITRGRRDSVSIQQFQEESKKLTEIFTQQEVFWKQRSKQLWLKEGDQNSKYFHASAKAKRKVNQIRVLQDEAGNSFDWDSGLQDLMTGYFDNLFKASVTEWGDVVNYIQTSVTEEQNLHMLKPVEHQEVKNALFHMHPDKSPGPDGMSPGFYQKYWSIVGKDITHLVQQYFLTGVLEEKVTGTNIVLIPKKSNPLLMTDLRPISLCNVVYKVVSKVLANRLKEVIDSLISES